MRKIRKGDEVIIISGKDKGKVGRVSKVINCRVVVEGVNKVKKHIKADPAHDVVGGFDTKEMSLHISNVSLRSPVANGLKTLSKVGIRLLDGKRVRYFKSNGELVDR